MKRQWRQFCAVGFALLLILTVTSFSIADAGSFSGDTDWGGGADWGSNTDWGSSSDWGSDSDWDTSSSNDIESFGSGVLADSILSDSENSGNKVDDDGFGTDFLLFILFAIVIAVVYFFIKSKKVKKGTELYQAQQEEPGLPIETLKQKDPNFNEQALLEKIGNQYVQMQQAWERHDWEPMRAIMTDTLFNQMARQLDVLKQQGLTNHVERIAVLNAHIQRYAVEGDNDVLVIRLQTRICDYTQNDQTGEIVSGNKTKELFMTYDWKLIRQKDKLTLKQAEMTEINCPNCGAPLSINQSGKCPYCNTVITLADHDWALSVIKGISQKSN
ncbi:MAG: zinc-ribbon domain-containing transport protein [Clostridia bacterium]